MTSLAGFAGMRAQFVLVVVLLGGLLASGAPPAAASAALDRHRDAVEDAERRESEARAQRERAEREEAGFQEEVARALARRAELTTSRDAALARLERLGEQFAEAAAAYESALTELTVIEADLEELEAVVVGLLAATEERGEQVGHLVRGLYKGGGHVATYAAVLRSEVASEATRRVGYLRSAQRSQRAIIDAFVAEHRSLERQQAEVEQMRERQAQATAELEERRTLLRQRLAAQEQEVDDLRAVVAAAEEELGELEIMLAGTSERVAALRTVEDVASSEAAAHREAEQAERERLEREERERREAQRAEEAEEARQARAARSAEEARAAKKAEEARAAKEAEQAKKADAEEATRTASAERTSRSSGTGSSGIACPVGQPRTFTDTYGAARSGGRSHMGTDILAPMGTPIYAYESGTITRMSNNRLGGITLYLRGDSGNVYYYAHLRGYVSGLSTRQRVSTGEQIGYNGDTGNAAGIPHLHIEVSPGGGSGVNPYPYMKRACG